eukprot:TRINITY_DN6978_c0_g1_i1.p1 TRINITY_DN6978_c0_g1~~TRINITY_DN6978_c0_g1_i1.p1  ORF type:complete len:272 (+),score=114.13 TRINITY_DN6978_c0_g1_i1:84-899(+)
MSEKLQIFYHPVSQPSRAVWALLLANKIEAEMTVVNFITGEHKQPEFLKVNPAALIPGMKDGDFMLGESHAIMRYLCDKYKVPDHWYPADIQARAKVNAVLDWHASSVRKGIIYFRLKYAADKLGMAPNAEMQEFGKNAYITGIEFMEKHNLSTTKFLVGDCISIADLAVFMELGFLQYDSEFDEVFAKNPKVAAWMKEMSAQPWYTEVFAMCRALMGASAPKPVDEMSEAELKAEVTQSRARIEELTREVATLKAAALQGTPGAALRSGK